MGSIPHCTPCPGGRCGRCWSTPMRPSLASAAETRAGWPVPSASAAARASRCRCSTSWTTRSKRRSGRAWTSTWSTSPRHATRCRGWPHCSASAERVTAAVSLRAVLFDAGNTLLFLDHGRVAAAVGAALGLPLSGPALAAASGAAACTMEQPRATDRERAAAYLEALFVQAGVPPGRMGEVQDCLTRLHRERHLWSGIAADTHAALSRLKDAGLKLGVVSNSDGRVEEALEAAGLRGYFDVVVDSALAGVE